MKIFVAGLPFAVSDQELQEIFEPYGTVGSAKVILDRETHKSRGFGFVEFASNEEAEKAITRYAIEFGPETPEEVRDRIIEAAQYIPLNQLGTTDDCGFSPFCDDTSTTRETAFAKIRSRVLGTALASEALHAP